MPVEAGEHHSLCHLGSTVHQGDEAWLGGLHGFGDGIDVRPLLRWRQTVHQPDEMMTARTSASFAGPAWASMVYFKQFTSLAVSLPFLAPSSSQWLKRNQWFTSSHAASMTASHFGLRCSFNLLKGDGSCSLAPSDVNYPGCINNPWLQRILRNRIYFLHTILMATLLLPSSILFSSGAFLLLFTLNFLQQLK